MKVLIPFLLCFLTACGIQLRHPICESSLIRLPDEFTGTYEIVVPNTSVAWSGNTVLKSIQVRIGPNSLVGSGDVDSIPGWGRICQIDNRYFVEERNSNGTYSFSEISKFSNGLILSVMSADLEAAKSKNFPLQYVPNFDKATGNVDEGFSLSLFSTSFVLDNTSLTAQQVLSVSKPISMQTVLREIPASTRFKPTIQWHLTKMGIESASSSQ